MAEIKKFTRYMMEETMTVKELRDLLVDVPDDTTIEMEVYDYSDRTDSETGIADIGSVNYDAETKLVTLREAS